MTMGLRGVLSLFVLLMAVSARGESKFILAEESRDEAFVVCTLTHGVDETSTPTAAFAALNLRTNQNAAVMTGVRQRGVVYPTIAPPVSRPRTDSAGHELPLQTSVAAEPGAELTSGTMLLRFRIPVRSLPATVQLASDEKRGGLRTWTGTRIVSDEVMSVLYLE